MNRKTFHIFIATWLTVLFTVIVPLHTHDDHSERDNCSICLLADQSSDAPATLFFSVIAVASHVIYYFTSSSPHSQIQLTYRTRAPPARQQ